MGDGDQGAGGPAARAVEAGPQVTGEPVHALDVEVVGGLVEDDDVGAAGEDRGQGDAAALAPGEGGDVGGQVEVGDEAGVDVTHGRVGGPLVLGGLAVDGGAHGGARRQVVGLAQDRHAHAAGAGDAAAVGLAPTGQGCQEGGLAGTVGAQDADAGAVLQSQGDLVQEQTGADRQAQVLHAEQVRQVNSSLQSSWKIFHSKPIN